MRETCGEASSRSTCLWSSSSSWHDVIPLFEGSISLMNIIYLQHASPNHNKNIPRNGSLWFLQPCPQTNFICQHVSDRDAKVVKHVQKPFFNHHLQETPRNPKKNPRNRGPLKGHRIIHTMRVEAEILRTSKVAKGIMGDSKGPTHPLNGTFSSKK